MGSFVAPHLLPLFAGWWFGTFFISHILGIIIPIDELRFLEWDETNQFDDDTCHLQLSLHFLPGIPEHRLVRGCMMKTGKTATDKHWPVMVSREMWQVYGLILPNFELLRFHMTDFLTLGPLSELCIDGL